MTERIINLVFLGITLSTLSGCSSLSAKKDFSDLKQTFEAKTQLTVEWDQNQQDNDVINQKIQELLQEKLTINTSVEIALMNNPSLQAAFEDLGIAKADLVQAGLFKNPSIHSFIRTPDNDGKTNVEFEISQDILDIFTSPLRKKLAREQLEQVKYRIGGAILNLDNEVKSAYYTLQAAQQMYSMQEKIVQAAQTAVDLAEGQIRSGNINDLILNGHQMSFYQAKMDLAQRAVEVKTAKEDIRRLMGLSVNNMSWEILDDLPFIANEEPPLEILEAKAISQNFELAIARQEVKVMEKGLKVHQINMIPEISGGYNAEKESDGGKLSGPMFEVEVPIFDQKQTGISRGKAELRQSQRRLEAKDDEIRSEVRKNYIKLLNTRQMVETYRDTLIPLRVKFTDSLQKHYNYMLVGIYDLLNAKKEEVETYHKFIEVLKDYWIIRSDLELLISERIEFVPYIKQSSKTEIETEMKPSLSQPMHHHNHGSHGGEK